MYIRRKKPKDKLTFTKIIMTVLVSLASIWITWSYVLASIALSVYDNADALSTLSEEVCRTILGVVIGYCVKSLAENISKYHKTDNSNAEG